MTLTYVLMTLALLLPTALVVAAWWMYHRQTRSVDVIAVVSDLVPEVEPALLALLHDRTIQRVICVEDTLSGQWTELLARLEQHWGGRLLVVHHQNMNKNGALLRGIQHVTAEQFVVVGVNFPRPLSPAPPPSSP